MPQLQSVLNGGSQRFFDKGTTGRWTGVLTAQDLALYQAKVSEKFTPQLAAWIAGGRLVTGDPREVPD